MNVTIFGTGYVGLVTGACFAEMGNRVLCVDVDEDRIAMLNDGLMPIYEPGLPALVATNRAAGRLTFGADGKAGVMEADVAFLAVGTPARSDGSTDLSPVFAVATSIGEHMDHPIVVATKSTVPVGTADEMGRIIQAKLDERGVDLRFAVVSNPEFLKEGAAISDFMKPDRIVLGSADEGATRLLEELYAPFNRNHDKILQMDVRSAELTKYAANVMLATRISLMNEFANFADRVGADIEAVRHGIGSDPRIGYQFIYAGCGYGGSCFPKDVRAMAYMAHEVGQSAEIVRSVEAVNQRQKRIVVDRLNEHFGGDLSGRALALWGLSFKPNTDDMREAPSRVVMEAAWAAGATVRAYDPVALAEAARLYGPREDLVLCRHRDEALAGADALVVVTEWNEFRSPDFDAIKAALKHPVIFDGRNLYDPRTLAALGLTHIGIGRNQSVSATKPGAHGAPRFTPAQAAPP
ncbi:MAG: UDP-glucose/GDP-mannose dehydrogenase family protein [Gammaproteobacteria bacterium]|nr:UDP-glucose/GDP-mannose dehydrogenase family protein [Gammaproteobacteria bacterium]MDE0444319.1 UDP-glucose/GDP-mannose dehydrogenase family protein [Gammaproteobacteria bacterium]